jgi:hypothetical protein
MRHAGILIVENPRLPDADLEELSRLEIAVDLMQRGLDRAADLARLDCAALRSGPDVELQGHVQHCQATCIRRKLVRRPDRDKRHIDPGARAIVNPRADKRRDARVRL